MPPPDVSTSSDRPPAAFGRDLWLAFASSLLFALGLGLYYQLLNVYAIRNLGAPRFMIGALVAIQVGMTALSYIPGAWAADHVRLKIVIVAGWWITVPAALCFALAPSWPWLVPGYLLTGLYMANNPAFKVYMMLKSEPDRVARNISYVFASFPLGMALGPLAGGWLAGRYGMRVVFLIAIVFYVASSIVITLIRDTPYHAAGQSWSLADLLGNHVFRRNLIFFFGAFFTVYLAQPFVQPYFAQVHHLGYTALGVLAGIGALGGSVITFVAGRAADVRGHRQGIGLTIGCLVLGALLVLAGWGPPGWAFAVFFYGAFDSFRFVTAGVVSRSFGSVPPVWGYAVFDASMGVPMACGSLAGGALYRAAYGLPFAFVIALGAGILLALAFAGRRRAPRAVAERDVAAPAVLAPSGLPSPASATLQGTKETS
ncbi:MAG TPA: MFS transporter [Thermoleophilia bacterium]|nr:MFS transporter [Thermoleophilia bacterium]